MESVESCFILGSSRWWRPWMWYCIPESDARGEGTNSIDICIPMMGPYEKYFESGIQICSMKFLRLKCDLIGRIGSQQFYWIIPSIWTGWKTYLRFVKGPCELQGHFSLWQCIFLKVPVSLSHTHLVALPWT